MNFLERADPMLSRGIPVMPLLPNSKIPILKNWETLATTDPFQICDWSEQYSQANCGCVATLDGVWMFETDSQDVIARLETETGEKIPKTFQVESSPNHYHFYWKATDASRRMGNLAQGFVKNADWSARHDRQFCVSPGSIHPKTGHPYEVVSDAPIIPAPDWLIDWCVSQKVTTAKVADDGISPIPRGSHDTVLTSIAGTLRNLKLDAEQMEYILIDVCEKRCVDYGSDYREMCSKIAHSVERYKPAEPTVTIGGLLPGQNLAVAMPKAEETLEDDPVQIEETRQRLIAKGLEESKVQQAVADQQAEQIKNWRLSFRSFDELEDGDVRMIINDFLPEGNVFIGALPGEAKTLFGLSLSKALTTGKPLLGNPEWFVPQIIPVIYMIPESSGRAFKSRMKAFQITRDEKLFLCRTVSEGATLGLDSPILQEAVRVMRPVVILDTLIRFNESGDEKDASQNKKLSDDMIKLRQMGAIAVIGLHHATKALRTEGMTPENILRGTGDLFAMSDAVYGLRRDDTLYADGAGPLEVDIRCLKPRDLRNPPQPFRIAASRKVEPGDGTVIVGQARNVVSVINETGDFKLVGQEVRQASLDSRLDALLSSSPDMTVTELATGMGVSTWVIRQSLKRLGWFKGRGIGGAWGKRPVLTPNSIV